MSSYYYLISSLPMLMANDEMPFRYDTFLEMCKSCVSQKSYDLLKDLTVDSTEGPLIAEWAEFYGALAKELAYQRNARLGQTAEAPIEHDEEASRTVNAALHAQNPLEAENMLLSLEFDRLDDLVGMHYFDDYVLNGYALKLKLLERQTIFNKAQGKVEFKRLFDSIQQQILNIGWESKNG